MKKVMMFFAIFLALILVFPAISAQTLTVSQQPAAVYNLGDIISVGISVRASSNTSGFLNMDLICGEDEINFYKNSFYISSGEEKRIESSLPITENIIGRMKGSCQIEASLNTASVLTSSFKVSDAIIVNSTLDKAEFSPGENIIIRGQASKETGRMVNGFVEVSIVENGVATLSQIDRVNNGAFSSNLSLPKEMKAGNNILRIKVYEVGSQGEETNAGILDKSIRIKQIPTNLRIIFETNNVEPGTNLEVKMVLYDQTGEKISTTSSLTIRNKDNKIVKQAEVQTDEFFEMPIPKSEPASLWKVNAVAENLKAEASFTIIEKENIDIQIIEKTLIITNTGNVPYAKNVIVKIGEKELSVDVNLKVGESKKYVLTAPNGDYNVEIISGEKTFSELVSLTGNAVDIRSAPGDIGSLMKHPSVWIFIFLILGFITFIVFKKGYQKAFIGYISSGKPKARVEDSFVPLEKNSLLGSSNKAELALSLKGDKQEVSVVAVNIKNLTEIQATKSNAEETIQKIIKGVEEHKAVTYENQNVIYFIISPARTRTFRNEKTALHVAMKIRDSLAYHNKMFKQKIIFGISVTHGTIVAKQERDSFKFASLGGLLATAKKISSIAHEDIFLDEKTNSLLGAQVKTTKHEKDKMNVYSLREIRSENEEHKKFIRKFMERNKR